MNRHGIVMLDAPCHGNGTGVKPRPVSLEGGLFLAKQLPDQCFLPGLLALYYTNGDTEIRHASKEARIISGPNRLHKCAEGAQAVGQKSVPRRGNAINFVTNRRASSEEKEELRSSSHAPGERRTCTEKLDPYSN